MAVNQLWSPRSGCSNSLTLVTVVHARQRSAVLIKITEDDALIVANDGKPVSRLGVLALCALDLSEKTGSDDELPEDYPEVPNSSFFDPSPTARSRSIKRTQTV